MREILFRAKRIDDGDWVEGGFWLNDTTTRQTMHVIDHDGDSHPVDPATLCQYTGLTDKNGVKIFEGDIIRWKHWDERYRERPVQYDYEWNRFCVWINGAGSLGVNKHLSEDIEVIGSIHDTPELIGQTATPHADPIE